MSSIAATPVHKGLRLRDSKGHVLVVETVFRSPRHGVRAPFAVIVHDNAHDREYVDLGDLESDIRHGALVTV